ncbi:COG1361 S-layer family protein [Methanococcus aeolicus]|uniref:S-layer domain-like protein n=1 Tax=Methanococcus aeolicus (strain ATCC BAA-1280 / DSM 17508 / OCM 812 / Nankai-3) TaxID=419665 RepID=A6UWP1_META3|nr:COG1361 S-layer family protein [Methanococcus aeolicus]ABR56913.1 conserved hypothetical protein [Methanococcus aeolicus Nankai-3]UXM84911.1 COG1361 S-layer family protein [Methanococcus aeolicus]
MKYIINKNSKRTKNNKYNFFGVVLGVISLILLIMPVSAMQIDSPQYRVDKLTPDETYPQIIHPGDTVDIWFKITNDDDDNVKDVKITVSPNYPFELKQVNPIEGTAEISHLNGGESDNAYFKFHINDNTQSGTYRINVNLMATKYKKEDGEIVESQINFTKIYYINIYSVAKFELNSNKDTISSPDANDIQLYIKNKGNGNAKAVVVNFRGSDNVNIVGPTTFYLNSINSKINKVISTQLYVTPKAEDKVYPITASISWVGEDGAPYNSTIPINIKVIKTIPNNTVLLYVDSYKYNPQGSEITIGVANRGATTVKHCILKIDGIKELNNNYIKYIGDLEEDDYDTVTFDVNVHPNESIPITVELRYFDNYNNEYIISKTHAVTFEEELKEQSEVYYAIIIILLVTILLAYYLYKRNKRKKLEKGFEEE